MNKDRRNDIARVQDTIMEIAALLDGVRDDTEAIRDEEQDYYDNMPESFQQGEKGEVAEAAISALDDALSALNDFDTDSIVAMLEEATA